jgi:regulatory protein
MPILNANRSSGSFIGQVAICEVVQGDLFAQPKHVKAKLQSQGRKFQISKGRAHKGFEMMLHTNDDADFKDYFRGENTDKKEINRLRSKAIRLLSMREHSRQEIICKLSKDGSNALMVHEIVEELIKNSYLSDRRFTESFVRSKQIRGFGPSKISSELKLKGVNNSLIDEYLKANSRIWYDSARVQYRKKYAGEPIKDYTTWAKRARFMQNRGFGMGHIQAALPTIDKG